jgi:hypothetical protein
MTERLRAREAGKDLLTDCKLRFEQDVRPFQVTAADPR